MLHGLQQVMHSYTCGPDPVTGTSGEIQATSHLLLSLRTMFLNTIILGFSYRQTKTCCPLTKDCSCPKLLRLYIYIMGMGPTCLTTHLMQHRDFRKYADFLGNLWASWDALLCESKSLQMQSVPRVFNQASG